MLIAFTFLVIVSINRLSRFAITSHPVEVLGYAFKHDYRKLMDEVAPLTIDKPVDELIACWESIPNRIFTIWVSSV